MTTFNDFNLDSTITKNLEEHNIFIPTQIQTLCIPEILQGSNIIAFSKTGSGKTLAYLIPILQKLQDLKWTKSDGLGAVIIAPTRELALQIYDMLSKINTKDERKGGHTAEDNATKNRCTKSSTMFSVNLLIGGTSNKVINSQILIGTPGRLLEVLQKDNYTAKIVVIDEVDKMCEMGFKEDVSDIIDYLYGEKQILRFSATCGLKVRYEQGDQLQQENQDSDMKNCIIIEKDCKVIVGDIEMPQTLKQYFWKVNLEDKLNLLYEFTRMNKKRKCLVFFSTCKEVKFMSYLFKCNILHGNLSQERRIAELQDFRKRKEGFLFCTDLGARGLDISGVEVVLQYDCPENAETYVHRVGRCGRNGNEGVSIVYLVKDEEKLILDVERRKWGRVQKNGSSKKRKTEEPGEIENDVKENGVKESDEKENDVKEREPQPLARDCDEAKDKKSNYKTDYAIVEKKSKMNFQDKIKSILNESIEAEICATKYLKSYVKFLQLSKKKYFGETLKEIEKMKNFLGIFDDVFEKKKEKNYNRKSEKKQAQ